MNIKFEDLKKAIFGAVYFPEKNGCLCPRRFTKKQLAHFVNTESYIHKLWKGKAASGMDIDFYTDSDFFGLDTFCYTASSQKYCHFDIFVNGEPVFSDGFDVAQNRDFNITTPLPRGEKRVTVYLPCLFGVDIKALRLSDGATFQPAKKDKKLLFLGDSITQGYTAVHPTRTYTSIVSRRLNAECLNQGIGANVFNHEDLDADIPYQPDLIFVAFGTNDWTHNRDLNKVAQEYITRLKSVFPGVKILVILPICRGKLKEREASTNVTFAKMHDILADACSGFDKVTVIDGRELVPDDMSLFMPDQTHPTEAGFKFYGESLLRRIENECI